MPAPRSLLPLALLSLTACHVGGGDLSWEFPDEDLEGVDLLLVNGSVDAFPAADGVLRIEWSGGGIGNRNLRPEPRVEGGVVYVDARCGEACGGDFTVWLPAGMDLSAQVDKGDVTVELGGRADVRACAAVGAVDLVVPAGAWDLDLRVGAGSLSFDGLTHDPDSPYRLEACTGIGDLTVLGVAAAG